MIWFHPQVLKNSVQEEDDWGPALSDNRQGRYAKGTNEVDDGAGHARKISSMQEPESVTITRKMTPSYQTNVERLWKL